MKFAFIAAKEVASPMHRCIDVSGGLQERRLRLEQTPGPEPARPLPLDKLLKEAERRLILLALERAGGKKWKAADLLEIPRPRLFRRMKALGLFPGDEPASEGLIEEDEPQIETDE